METQIHVPVGAQAVRKFSIHVDEHDLLGGAMKLMKELRPAWDPERVKTKLFTDGTTNKLLGVYAEERPDDVVLVRVYGHKTELFVDRDNELASFRLLHANGCAPRLYGTFRNGFCYEYMAGDALGPRDVREPALIALIAGEMARVHVIREARNNNNGRVVPEPMLWIRMREYFALVAGELAEQASDSCGGGGGGIGAPPRRDEVPSRAALEEEMAWLKEHLSALGSPVVLCHNDLLCKNIVHNGQEGTVRLIDYEYAGYNYQAFDIGNHFNEFAGMSDPDYGLYPGRELQTEWLRAYLRAYNLLTEGTDDATEVTPRELETLYVQVNKFALASHCFWGLWALIQAKYSAIDFDFLGYAVLRFDQYFKTKPVAMALQMPE